MDIKNLLDIRKKSKAKKPDFVRQDIHKSSGLKRKWRRPKGLHSKLRLKIRGKGKPISQGYRSPKKVRGLHKSGLQLKIISSTEDVGSLDSKKHGLVISSSLGKKKRIVILKKAKDAGFNVLNIKEIDNYIKKVDDWMDAKKKLKKEEKKDIKSKDEKKEKLSDKVSEEEKKDTEKKEKDRLLSKRER